MAKKRKAARASAAKRPTKKRTIRTAKLKGRKVANRKAKRVAPRKKQGIISSAVQSVTETLGLRSKLEGRNTFED